MNRILFSVNPLDRTTDFMIVDGEVVKNESTRFQIEKQLNTFHHLKKIFSDDFFTIYKGDDFFVLNSFYKEKDEGDRQIYYVYKINDSLSIDQILGFLEKDSSVIERTIDKENVLKTLKLIKEHKNYKLLAKAILGIGIGILCYLLFK